MLEPHEVDALRVRDGIPAFPNEINEQHNPWEARLDDALSLTKGCYIGQEVVARLNTYKKIRRKLVRLDLQWPMEAGTEIAKEGEVIGRLTTVAGLKALAYVDTDLLEPGTTFDSATVCDDSF